MSIQWPNPFTITKASDFSDKQILEYWVELSNKGRFSQLAKPTSPMPMLILGGKGCGKTHLMRYFSYPLQKMRYPEHLLQGIVSEKYIGVYVRCAGLNPSRFQGKGQSEETWIHIFEYYMELWIAQLLLTTVYDLLATENEFQEQEAAICKKIVNLFDSHDFKKPKTIVTIVEVLSVFQKELDFAINNCAITRNLTVKIRLTRSKFIFGVPTILAEHIPSLQSIQFQYLVDEIENLSFDQQRYINTLVRDRVEKCSFKIGARLYGTKTFSTYSAGEENKEGSEYEKFPLDEFLRNDIAYPNFARKMIVRRLRENGYDIGMEESREVLKRLDSYFEVPPKSKFAHAETAFVREKYAERDRPYFAALKSKLQQNASNSSRAIEQIVRSLACPEYPLLEKLNIYLFYRAWSTGSALIAASLEIRNACAALMNDSTPPSKYIQTLEHFKADFMSQLRRECDRRQIYAGVSTFVIMSCGLPRNLLNILKHIFKYSTFNGEKPFKAAIDFIGCNV